MTTRKLWLAVLCVSTSLSVLVLGSCSNHHIVSIALTPQNPSVAAVGQTTQFTAMGTSNDSHISPTDVTSTATWTSSTASVATISASGLATATGCGATTITAQQSGITGSTQLTVSCSGGGSGGTPVLQSISLAPTNPTVPQVGQTTQFIAVGTYTSGSTADLSNLATWASSNVAIVTIDGTGLAKAATCGTTTITAEYQGVLAQTQLTVSCTQSNPVLQSVAVYPGNPSVPQIGQTTQFIALGTYSPAISNDNVTSQATWASSNIAVATVNSSGLATAVSCGTTTVTAQYGGFISQTQLTIACTVSQNPVLQSISVYPGNATVPTVGQTTQFIALGGYSPTSSNNDLTSAATWASSDTSIASITSSGLATAAGCGTTTITAMYLGVLGQTQFTSSCTSPPAPVLQSITLYPANGNVTQYGQNVQFTALGVFNPPSNNDILTNVVTWSSTNTGIATIDASGLITSTGCGTTTISAEYQGIIGTTPFTVQCTGNQQLQSITILPNAPTVPQIGQITQFAALGNLVGGGQEDLTSSAIWTSSNQQVAIVSGAGTATTLGCGTTTIGAQFQPAGGTLVTGSTLLTVACNSITSIELIVQKSGSVAGTVTSVPAGIDCGMVCGGLFNEGTGFVLTGAPAPTSWTGCDQVISDQCYFTLIPDASTPTQKLVGVTF